MLRPRWGVAGREIPGSLLFFLLFTLFFASHGVAAEPYHVSTEVRILSEYAAANASLPPRTEIWRVSSEEKGDHGWELLFFLSEGESGGAICKVRIFPQIEGDGRKIEFRARGMGETAFKDIMVLLNFPVPCDVLPVEPDAEDRTYTQKRAAGGARFIAHYRAVREDVAPEEALEKGWIKKGAQIQSPLTMISVSDDQGRMVVKQLWSQGDEWWLYEENDVRRSWLISSEIND